MNEVLGPSAVPAGTVVVGIDTHDSWQHAVDWAADEAALERRALTLVHVSDAAEELWHDAAGRDTRVGVPPGPTIAALVIERARARGAARAPDVTVHAVLCGGGLRDSLHTVAHDAHLLVVAASSHRSAWSRLFGTVGSTISRRPPCPVVIVHAVSLATGSRGVLVGVDDTEHSQGALRFGFRLASLRGLPLTVVHVALEPTYGAPRDEQEQRLQMAETVAGLRETYPDVHVRTTVERGDPAGELVRAGLGMSLIVLGAHHGRPFSDVLRGSVVAPVVERAGCPVAVVPDQQDPTTGRRTS